MDSPKSEHSTNTSAGNQKPMSYSIFTRKCTFRFIEIHKKRRRRLTFSTISWKTCSMPALVLALASINNMPRVCAHSSASSRCTTRSCSQVQDHTSCFIGTRVISRGSTSATRSILFPTSSFTILRPPPAQYVSTSCNHVARFSNVSRRPTS